MPELKEYRSKLDQQKGKRDQIKSQITKAKRNLFHNETQLIRIEEALVIIQTVAKLTQEELEYHISDIVSLALGAVFDDPYKLKVEFVIKRGKTECLLWFERDGELIHPLSSSGGGAIDVASFALRIALWGLSQPKPRPVLILDENFKHISSDLQSRAGLMLKEISKKIGLQIILVSHVPDLIESADRVFEVSIKKGVSQIVVK